MPRQTAFEKIEEYEADRLQVITPALLNAKMRIDTGVAGGARQRFVIFVWNMFTCFWIAVSLYKAEIYNVNDVLFLTVTDEEVIRFHVSVDEVIIVQELQSLNHLVGNH